MAIGSIVHLLLSMLLHLLGGWLARVGLYIGRILGQALAEIAPLDLVHRLALVRFLRGGRRVVNRDRRFVFLPRLFVGWQQSAFLL